MMTQVNSLGVNLDTYWLNVKHERNILRGEKWTISFEIDEQNWTDFLAGELMKHTPEEGYRNLPEAILNKLLAYAKEGKFGIVLTQPAP